MTKTFFADTNIFLRFLLKDVPSQYEIARGWFREAKEGKIKIVVCQGIIFEIEFALAKYYKFKRTQVVDSLGTIVGIPYLEVEDRNVFQSALLLYLRSKQDLVDCFLYTMAQTANGEVLSFDKKIKKLR